MLRKLISLAFFFFAASITTHGQSCTTATCNATTCNTADVLAALPSNSNSNTSVVVNIPSGTCLWTSKIVFAAPAAITGTFTVQGQTTCTGSGDPASNNLVCTDHTIIQDNDTNSSDATLLFLANDHGGMRITGLTIQKGTGTTKDSGLLEGRSAALRIDHNAIYGDTGTSASPLVAIQGCSRGVADHNHLRNNSSATANGILFYNGVNCGGTDSIGGDNIWNQATGFGTSDFFFFEQNLTEVNQEQPAEELKDDCTFGGKGVRRFNTYTNGASLQTHPTGGSGVRGCRATEAYRNQSIVTISFPNASPFFFFSSGPAMFWGNKMTTNQASWVTVVAFKDCRIQGTGCGYTQFAPPTGWGYCGASSGWDGNVGNGGANTDSPGYPCIDQPNRGQGDLLSGTFPNMCNITLNPACNIFTGQWPRQKLEPLYYFLNTAPSSMSPVAANGLGTINTQNVDYYVSSDSLSGTDCTGFTGATGVGCGPRSSRPSTCTTGVGWWSTDQGSWNLSGNGAGNGVLDICTATNTWTNASYTPYTYPHPLEGNSPVFSFSPTFLSFGSVLVGSTSPAQNIVVSNTGSATFTISSIALGGTNPADFTESNNCGTAVSPGGSCTVVAKCQPVSATSFAANVTVTDSAPGSPHTAPLTCTGTTATAGISFSPTVLSFSAQTVGTSSSPQTVTVTNTGSANLVITNVAVTGGNNTSFSQTNSCGTVAASGTCPINVTFTPQAAGALASTVCVTDNAPASPQCFNISGTGNTTGNLNFSPASLTFPNQAIHTTSAVMTFTATNSGGSAITISSIAVTGTNAADFAQTNNCGTSIAAGGSCTVSVKFTPSANGSRTAAVTLTDTAPGSPQSVSLQGTGFTPAPAVTLSTTTVAFGNQTVGTQSNAQVVILTNSGTATLTVSTATMSGANPGDFGFSTTCGASLAVNASCSYSLTFSPTTSGSRAATFNVNTNAASSPNTVSLTGTGMTSPNGAPAPQVFGD